MFGYLSLGTREDSVESVYNYPRIVTRIDSPRITEDPALRIS